jgi:hypothetical protein
MPRRRPVSAGPQSKGQPAQVSDEKSGRFARSSATCLLGYALDAAIAVGVVVNCVWLAWAENWMDQLESGVSPYSTGGGGVTFERKVAVQFLARLLLGHGASCLGLGRIVVQVSFQQSPEFAVDDLVIHAAHADETVPSLVMALAVRRAPKIVDSDPPTRKLVRAYTSQILASQSSGAEIALGLVVAGPNNVHASQLAELADFAAQQTSPAPFFRLIRTPHRFNANVRGRLDQWEKLVKRSLVDLDVVNPTSDYVQQCAWQILSRLSVLSPRLESPDETDWDQVANDLIGISRNVDLESALALRDRLVALADDWAPKAAMVDLRLLRRSAHLQLDSEVRRYRQGWQALRHLHTDAVGSVRDCVGTADGRQAHVDREELERDLLKLVSTADSVVVHGDSGVGKSALAIGALTEAARRSPDEFQVVALNLRSLPESTLAFESHLGVPLSTLLDELSAPSRVLIVDGADAVAEGKLHQWRYLLAAGRDSGSLVVAVATSETQKALRDTILESGLAAIGECHISLLDDAEIDALLTTFPELSTLAENERSRDLLRRPVVFDLLARGDLQGVPLSDADAMFQIWSGLVRRPGNADRGAPHARESALLRLAEASLTGSDRLDALTAMDSTAVEGLRRDGLLKTAADDPFRIGPEFSHDEVRRYALARLLLASPDIASRLADAGAPRWVLSAARLASQVSLAASDAPGNRLRGRFSRLQDAFDALVTSGHGARWGDVPGEALLTLADPTPLLGDAWPYLRRNEDAGLRRLSRLVIQRLTGTSGFVKLSAIEPLIDLLLEDETPWTAGEYAQIILRKWLHALLSCHTNSGHPLRTRLRTRLLAACEAADSRRNQRRTAEAAEREARPARTPEEVKEDERRQDLIRTITGGRTPRRARGDVPREFTDEILLELFALLGPDLGAEGEAVLRRVAEEAPAYLWPAVEKPYTDLGLAQVRQGVLAELTEAYFVDDEPAWSGHLEFGIRHHRATTITPPSAWYYGPFRVLFQSDFTNGVATLNRMLNHAARICVQESSRTGGRFGFGPPVQDDSEAQIELNILGDQRKYIGDVRVWLWYRGGIAIGPPPMMSALLALERACDELIRAGVSLERLVSVLLTGCENLAMVALVAGVLIRHIDTGGSQLDPFLVEPAIWEFELARIDAERMGSVAPSEGITGAERRQWMLGDVVMRLVLSAEGPRIDELQELGEQLVRNGRRDIEQRHGVLDEESIARKLVRVRASAAVFDRRTYTFSDTEEGIHVQAEPSPDVADAIDRNSEYAEAYLQEAKLKVKYYVDPRNKVQHNHTTETLTEDLESVRELLDRMPSAGTGFEWDVPAMVAATALECHFIDGVELPSGLTYFAAQIVLTVASDRDDPDADHFESVYSYFEQGARRSAARALPLLLLPQAAELRAELDPEADDTDIVAEIYSLAAHLAHDVPNEVRVHLARGLDHVWTAPCAGSGVCHHVAAYGLAVETMHGCVFGGSDEFGRRELVSLSEPVVETLADIRDDLIFIARLDGVIRAMAPAAVAGICVSKRAREFLDVAVDAHRRGQLAHRENYDDRGTHALYVARALLTVTSDEREGLVPVMKHLESLAGRAEFMKNFLTAVAAAAEETSTRSETARRIWPAVVAKVIDLHHAGRTVFNRRHDGDMTLAALIPNRTTEYHWLYRELANEPIQWWDPTEWRDTVEQWLPNARGNTSCIDQLVGFLSPMNGTDVADIGLQWMADLVLAAPDDVASRTYLLVDWLIEIQPAARENDGERVWQQIVDALVVSGESRLAPYSV